MKNILPAFITLVLLIGCSPDDYKRDADLQVDKLLSDRKQTTLGYAPKTTAGDGPTSAPTTRSYAKIPATVIPPPTVPVMEPAHIELKYERLGPAAPEGEASGDMPAFQTADLARESAQRLRLGPSAAGPQAVVQVDLFKSIGYAVHHSRDYQTQMESLYTATLDVLLERHAFELQPTARSTIGYTRGPISRDTVEVNGITVERSRYDSALRATSSVGLRQRLPYGGQIEAAAIVAFTDALNDSTEDGESSQIALTGTIPLMRGAGIINLEPLIQTERELVYTVRNFENFRRDFACTIADRYFDLVTQQQAIVNRRIKYLSSTGLTERTRELYAAGRINFLQVQQSLQESLRDEDALVRAEEGYENQLDSFKILLGMPVEQNLDVQAVELDVNLPDIEHVDLAALAVKFRLDLQSDRDRIEDARRRVDVAKNQLLPDLNVTGGATIGNRPNGSFSRIDPDQFTYNARLELDWPLDRVSERNAYRVSLIQFDQTQRRYDLNRDNVIADARASVRALRSAQISYNIQRRAIDLAQRRLEYSNELLIQGKAIARDVVESQTALLSAQDQFAVARARLQTQILFLLRDTGTLRLDPDAGSLGHAMDLAVTNGPSATNGPPGDESRGKTPS